MKGKRPATRRPRARWLAICAALSVMVAVVKLLTSSEPERLLTVALYGAIGAVPPSAGSRIRDDEREPVDP